MNPILQGLQSGYSPQQIIKFLSHSIPQMAPYIKKAQKAGYPAQQILGFLSKNFETEDRRGMSESQRHAVNSRADAERAKYGLKAAGIAVAAPIAAVGARAALSRALPASLTQGTGLLANANNPAGTTGNQPQISGQPGTTTAPIIPQSQNISSQQPPVAPNIPQTPDIQPPQIKPLPTEITGKIDELIRSGNGPEEVTAYFKNFNPKAVKEVEKSSGLPFGEAVKQHIASSPNGPTTVPTEEVEKPIEKHQTVISPQGAGEVREIRGDKALIEVDGKLHKVDTDELIGSDIPEKDVADLYEELIGTIEKKTGEDVSRMVNYAGYDPKTNKLVFLPHDGALYEYSDIEPEEMELLTNILNVRKTSGENFIGAWKAGSKSPIGSAMSALIKKLQSQAGGKGKEYSGKYETVYSYLEPAIKAAKKKKKKK